MVVVKTRQILLSVAEKVKFVNHSGLYTSAGKDDNILPLERSYIQITLSDENTDLAYSPTTKYKIVTSTSPRGNSTTLSFGVEVGEDIKETRYLN